MEEKDNLSNKEECKCVENEECSCAEENCCFEEEK